MPIYEYECLECRNRFQLRQGFNDPLEKECPACKGKVQKIISPPAIQFKGTGWYITDYARKDSTDKPAKKTTGAKETAAATTTTTTTKTD